MRSNLQAEIDQNMQDPEGSCYSFVCRGSNGDVVIPKNVCIRFIECTFSGIAAEGNNILNFDNCTFLKEGRFSFVDGVVNINNCRIRQDLTANSCKFYISNCDEVLGQVKLDNNSYGKSHKNKFNSENASFYIVERSKLESYSDSFSNNTKEIFIIKNKSYVKLSEGEFTTTAELGVVDESSELQVYNIKRFIGQPNKSFAHISNKSVLKIHTIEKLDIKSSAIILSNNSTCYLNNITDVLVKDSFIQSDDSFVNISKVDTIRNTENGLAVFKGKNSVINLYDINNIFSVNGSCFYLEDTPLLYVNKNNSAVIIANKGDTVFAKSVVNTDKISIVLNNFNTIESTTGTSFNLKNTSLKISSVTNIKGNQHAIHATDTGKIVISDVDSIFAYTGDTIFLEQDGSKLFISNIDSIGSAGGTAVNILEGSFYAKGIRNIEAKTTAIVAQSSVCVLEDIGRIYGTETGMFLTGSASLSVKNIERIEGRTKKGIYAINTKGTIDIEMSSTGSIYGKERAIEALCDTTIVGKLLSENSSKIISDSEEAAVFNSNITTLSNIKLEKGLHISRSITTLNNVTVAGTTEVADSILTTNYSLLEDLKATTTSVITNNRSKYAGEQKVINSVLSNLLTEISGNVTVSSGVLQNYISEPASDISLENSGFLGLASSFQTLDLKGRSTFIGGASRVGRPGTITCGKSGPFTNPTGAFIVRSGDLALASDERLYIETEEMKANIRNTAEINVTTSYKIVVGTSSIFVDINEIELKAVSVGILTEKVR